LYQCFKEVEEVLTESGSTTEMKSPAHPEVKKVFELLSEIVPPSIEDAVFRSDINLKGFLKAVDCSPSA